MDPVMAFPFGGYGVATVFDPKTVEQVYSTALRNILMTAKGSVPWDPEFGSLLRSFVFDLNDVINQQLILYYAFRDIQRQEPRLRIVAMDSTFEPDEYLVSFAVTFIAFDDPSQTARTANIAAIPLGKAS